MNWWLRSRTLAVGKDYPRGLRALSRVRDSLGGSFGTPIASEGLGPEAAAVHGGCSPAVAVLKKAGRKVHELNAFRDIDHAHVRDLCKVGLIEDASVGRIPPEPRPRFD
ncbi:MAG: hypothetical protein ACUVXJ_14920 [Phycisphaerae bacterium]